MNAIKTARSGRRARRAILAAGSVVTLTLALAACGGDSLEEDNDTAGGQSALVIGGAGFTEASIMAELYAAVLDDAGFETSITTVEGRELYEPELERGSIDIVPEYAATMAEFLNKKVHGPEAETVASNDINATVEALRELAEPLGLRVLEAGDAVNQNAFAVTEEFAAEHGLTTLTDLGESGLPVKLAAGEDCPERPFCQPGLENVYGIDISEIDPKGVGTTQAKQAVQNGTDDMVLVTTTDATLSEFGLVLLEDDQNLQQADNLLPVVNADSAGDEEIASALTQLTRALTTEDLIELNRQVDSERLKAADVARDYLQDKHLIGQD